CQDRTGRIYFRYAPHGPGVGVLWPSQERSGDTLRIAPSCHMYRVLQGTDGTIWGQPGMGLDESMPGGRLGPALGAALVRWDGAGWQDTPVKIPPHPEWRNRSSPPW